MRPNHLGGQTPEDIQEENAMFNALAWSGQETLAEELMGPAIASNVAYGHHEVDLDRKQTRTVLRAVHKVARGRLRLLPGNDETARGMWATARVSRAERFRVVLANLLDV